MRHAIAAFAFLLPIAAIAQGGGTESPDAAAEVRPGRSGPYWLYGRTTGSARFTPGIPLLNLAFHIP